jgi:hypothetical protein
MAKLFSANQRTYFGSGKGLSGTYFKGIRLCPNLIRMTRSSQAESRQKNQHDAAVWHHVASILPEAQQVIAHIDEFVSKYVA